MRLFEIITEAPAINRYTSTSTSDAGVTTTKFVGGGKSVSNDAGTTTYNASGRKTNYQSPTVKGFKQELKFKGGPRIDNVKNTYTTNIGGVNVTKSTDGAGNMTSARMDSGNASVKVDNKGNKSASYNLTDRDRMRVSNLATPASNIRNLNKLKNIGSS